MRAYVIQIDNHKGSATEVERMFKSHKEVSNDFEVEVFSASTPLTSCYEDRGLVYQCKHNDHSTPSKAACAMSHYRLWERAAELQEDVMVLEHDAMWVRKFEEETIPFALTCLYRPGGDKKVPIGPNGECESGGVVAKGYVITPSAAEMLIATVKDRGFIQKNDSNYGSANFGCFMPDYLCDEPWYYKKTLRTSHNWENHK